MDWNTLAGVALGAFLTYVIQKLTKQDDRALDARLALTGTLSLLWGGTEFQVLKKHLHRLKVQLEEAKVKSTLIKELEESAWSCWRYSVAEAEQHFDPTIGYSVSMDLLEAYETLEARVHDALRTAWWQFWK